MLHYPPAPSKFQFLPLRTSFSKFWIDYKLRDNVVNKNLNKSCWHVIFLFSFYTIEQSMKIFFV